MADFRRQAVDPRIYKASSAENCSRLPKGRMADIRHRRKYIRKGAEVSPSRTGHASKFTMMGSK